MQLIEREPELAAVAGLLAAGGGSLVIAGGAGLGKTSLLSEACRQADACGYAAVRARGPNWRPTSPMAWCGSSSSGGS